MVNGNTWPFQKVEQGRYRFRFLNGCQSRFLILDFSEIPDVEVWAIGNEGGFLSAPVNLTATNGNRLLLAPAERADLIVDFTNVPVGQPRAAQRRPGRAVRGRKARVTTSAPRTRIRRARSCSSGSCRRTAPDPTTPPRQFLQLPAIPPLPTRDRRPGRWHSSRRHADGIRLPPMTESGGAGRGTARDGGTDGVCRSSGMWMDEVTENPAVGGTEMWEIYNTTEDAHPMHVHEVAFEVVNRQGLVLDDDGEVEQPDRAGWRSSCRPSPGRPG